MNREIHVQFCESLGVKFPRATRLAGFRNNSENTISGIVNLIEKALKITKDIADKLCAYGCFA